MALFSRPELIRRRPDGGFDVLFDEEDRATIAALLIDLAARIDDAEGGEADGGLRRLHPPAYLDDEQQDAAYQLLAGDELRSSRREAIASVLASLERETITEGEAWAWVRSLNALRLVVGTELDVSEDDDLDLWGRRRRAREDSRWVVYEFTTHVQHEVVRALSS